MNVEALEIVQYPAKVLRQKAKPVGAIDEEVKAVAARMIELMREEEGVGLAAPQVGLSWRMFVTVAEKDKPKEPAKVYINPVLKLSGENEEMEEGCLSLPNIHVEVLRPKTAEITALGLDGKEI
ncbi:MAG TPA: peptide deformylase, partial [Phycisphaerales bacterium]|nr:peptide deformylase [Phycisphaerales bacterium]